MSVCRAGDGNDLARGTRVKCPPTLLLLLRRAHFRREATPPFFLSWRRRQRLGTPRSRGAGTDVRFGRLSRGCYLARKLSSLQENAQNAKTPQTRPDDSRSKSCCGGGDAARSPTLAAIIAIIAITFERGQAAPGDGVAPCSLDPLPAARRCSVSRAPPRVPNCQCTTDILGLRGSPYEEVRRRVRTGLRTQ